jgi:hypothetical protein
MRSTTDYELYRILVLSQDEEMRYSAAQEWARRFPSKCEFFKEWAIKAHVLAYRLLASVVHFAAYVDDREVLYGKNTLKGAFEAVQAVVAEYGPVDVYLVVWYNHSIIDKVFIGQAV